MHLCEPLLVVHPTHILVQPRVHRAHRLKSAVLDDHFQRFLLCFALLLNQCCPNISILAGASKR